MPLLVMILFYLRGLYRTRLRALVLDGLVPVLSAVSVAAMAVAMIGIYANGAIPDHFVRTWLLAVLVVGGGRALLSLLQRWARARRLVGKPVLIMGAGVVGAQVARRLESHPEYGLVPVGFLDEDPRSVAEVGGRDVPVLGTVEDLDDAVSSTGVRNLIVAFSSVADARVSRLIQRCQELGIEVSVVPRMFDTINNRVGYETVGGLPLMSFTSVNPRGLQFAIKHGLDRVLALALLVVLSPLIIGAALAVRLTSSVAWAATARPSTSSSSAQWAFRAAASSRRTRTRMAARCGSCWAETPLPAESRATIAAPPWAVFCGAPRWMSCHSCSTCSKAR